MTEMEAEILRLNSRFRNQEEKSLEWSDFAADNFSTLFLATSYVVAFVTGFLLLFFLSGPIQQLLSALFSPLPLNLTFFAWNSYPQSSIWEMQFRDLPVIDESFNFSNNARESLNFSSKSEDLFNAWKAIYNLDSESPPAANITSLVNGTFYPIASHLQDCARLTAQRILLDQVNQSHSVPQWALPSNGVNDVHPPWVLGSDDDNLPLTRYIQTEIWKNQFPGDCHASTVKFAIIEWPSVKKNDLAVQLHSFARLLAAAVAQGRTAVLMAGSFERAEESLCSGENKHSLNCFFFPVVSAECEKRALELWKGKNSDLVSQITPKSLGTEAVPGASLAPWMNMSFSVELLAGIAQLPEASRKSNYVYSQALRFILRWPSALLCHHTNIARHKTYGREVAAMVSHAEEDRLAIFHSLGAMSGDEAEGITAAETRINQQSDTYLETSVWWDQQPYLPHPILSIHVGQGGKQSVDFSLASHMWMAQRLRRHVPDIRNVWLATELQQVIEETVVFKRWKFYFTNTTRHDGKSPVKSGIGELAGSALDSFVNLIIGSECDYFVGALESDWPRLINELRLTNGRVNRGFLALNYGDS